MLSQAEIDALLSGAIQAEDARSGESLNLANLMGENAAAEGAPAHAPAEADKRNIRPYNFWSPDRFSKEQMRAVELVHENLAERLTTSMPPYIRTDFRPRVVHVEQGRSDDFMKELPNGTLFHILALDPLPGRMMVVFSSDIIWVMLDRLLGGAGNSNTKGKTLTDIGQALMNGTVEYMLNDITAAWGKMIPLIEPRLEDSTNNHHWVQMMMGNARILNVVFEVTIQQTTIGTMGIYVPFMMLKPVANLLNPHVWIAGQEDQAPTDASREKVYKRLAKVPLTVRVELGSAELGIGELLDLQPGDVIRLDRSADAELPVYVSDRLRYFARPGMLKGRMCVQIKSLVNVDDDPTLFEVSTHA
jgi:flagellar motor switch protein FliM